MPPRRSKRYMRNTRNRSQLHGSLSSRGLEVWRHFFWAKPLEDDAVLQPFLLEYLLLNPSHKERKQQPYFHLKGSSFAMVRLIRLGANQECVAEFFSMKDVELSKNILSMRFGRNICLEDALQGQLISMDKEIGIRFGLSSTGSVKWDLNVQKSQSYGYGFSASRLFTAYNIVGMSWHVGALKASFDGYLAMNDDEYSVQSISSYGFQDKMWGAYLGDVWNKLYGGVLILDGEPQKEDALTIFRHRRTRWGRAKGFTYHFIYTHKGVLYDFSSDAKKVLYTFSEELQADGSTLACMEAITPTERLSVKVVLALQDRTKVAYPYPMGGTLSLHIVAPACGLVELSTLIPLVGWQLQVTQQLQFAVYESSALP
jgi:hypothetical protein